MEEMWTLRRLNGGGAKHKRLGSVGRWMQQVWGQACNAGVCAGWAGAVWTRDAVLGSRTNKRMHHASMQDTQLHSPAPHTIIFVPSPIQHHGNLGHAGAACEGALLRQAAGRVQRSH